MAGFMNRLFRGAETPAEEKKEATALKSGAISKKQYVAGEKAEGHGANAAKKATAIKSGKLSPAAYAKQEKAEGMKKGGCATKKLACGGKTKKMAAGGKVRGCGVATKGKTKGKMV